VSKPWARAIEAVGNAWVRLGIVLFVLVPVLRQPVRTWRDGIPTGIALLALVWISKRSFSKRNSYRLLAATLVVFIGLQILIATNQASEPFSDFLTQWETASLYASEGLTLPDSPQAQRSLPFFYPLILVFGAGPSVYIAANIVVTTLSWLMTVWISRRFFGWGGAARTGFLLVFAYEAYLANNIPNHDTLGAWGLLLFLLLLTEFEQVMQREAGTIIRVMGFTAGTSVVIAWTEWQRGTGIYCFAALLLYAVSALASRTTGKGLRVAFVILSVASSFAILGQLRSAGLIPVMPPSHITSTEMNLLAFSGYDGQKRYVDKLEASRAVTSLESEKIQVLGRTMFLETLRSAPMAKYENYLGATSLLLRFGHSLSWYIRTDDPGRYFPVDNVKRIYESVRGVVTPVLWGLLILASWAILKRPGRIFDYRWLPFFIVAVYLIVLGALSETQPRYSYFVFFLVAIYAGCPWWTEFGWAKRTVAFDLGASKKYSRKALGQLAAYGAVILLSVLIHRGVTAAHDVYLVNFHQADLVGGSGPILDREKLLADFGVTVRQNSVKVRRPVAPEQPRELGLAIDFVAKSTDTAVLSFVIENGPPLDERGDLVDPEAIKFNGAPGRFLQLVLDGQPRRTLDLTRLFAPSAIEVGDIAPGRHRLDLIFHFGDSQPEQGEVETVVSYLGIY